MKTKHFFHSVLAILSIALATAASAQNCTADRWYPLIPASAIGSANGGLAALLTVGPPGAQITYAGGGFTQIGGVAATESLRGMALRGMRWELVSTMGLCLRLRNSMTAPARRSMPQGRCGRLRESR